MTRRVLVVGTSTYNKGAELMHAAIQQELARAGLGRVIVPGGFGPVEDRARYAADLYVEPDRFHRDRIGRALVPGRMRAALGLAWDDDFQAVIDASGFAFSDQLGLQRIQSAAIDFARWRRQGKEIVLLPQALGPFEHPGIRAAMRSICESASLIYAREETSWGHLQGVARDGSKIRRAGDFTALVDPAPASLCEAPSGGLCVVPNKRMVTNTDGGVAQRYIDFLRRIVKQFKEDGIPVWILVHDRGDHELAGEVATASPGGIRIWHHEDARMLKAALGRADMVLGSRFHALVSSLCQGVPSVATSWSFKYRELMSGFGVADHLINEEASVDECLQFVQDAWRGRAATSRLIAARAADLHLSVTSMWAEVFEVLDVSRCRMNHRTSSRE